MPEEDTTVSVEFEKGYLLSYDRNYDSVEGDDPAPVYYLPGETVELIDGSHYYYKEHHTFIGWECDGEFYQVGSLFTMPEKDVTLTARWSENIYTVDVIVKTADGSSAEGIEVRALQNGVLYEHSYENENIVVESEVVTTGSAYLKLPAGVYSVEANVYTQSGALDRNASVVVEVTGEDTVVEVALPGDSVSSGLVFDESDAPEDEDVAAPLAVGGLDKVAAEHGKGEDSHVRAEMNIAPKGKDDVNDDHKKEIERKSRDHGKGGKKQFFSFLDISVGLLVGDSTKAEPLSKTGVVLEIILSYDMEGKDNLNLYRHHNGAVNVFGKLDKRAEKAEDRVDGKVFFDEENGRIYIYTNLFSTYAIGYGVDETDVIPEEDPVVEGGGGGGGYSGPVTIPGKKPEQPKEEEPKDETGSFVDVPAGAYYTEAVAWAVEKGITNGMGDGTFAPNASCTRAQMVTFLYRAAGSPSVAGDVSFSDVSADAYYANAIAWAVANGITNGMGDGTFAPDAECTRAQMATFLYRMQGGAASGESGFADVETGAYYADAVAWAVANGITNGMGDGTFAPNSNCTRGQMVTFLFRCFAE